MTKKDVIIVNEFPHIPTKEELFKNMTKDLYPKVTDPTPYTPSKTYPHTIGDIVHIDVKEDGIIKKLLRKLHIIGRI